MAVTKKQLIDRVRELVEDVEWSETSILDHLNQGLLEMAAGRIDVGSASFEFDLPDLLTSDDLVLGTVETVVAVGNVTSLTLASNSISGEDAAERLANVYQVRVKEVDKDDYTSVTVLTVSDDNEAVLVITSIGASATIKLQYEITYAPVPSTAFMAFPPDYHRNLFWATSQTHEERITIFKSFQRFLKRDSELDDEGNVNRLFPQGTQKLYFGDIGADTLTLRYSRKSVPMAEQVFTLTSTATARPRVDEKISGGSSSAIGYIVWFNATDSKIGVSRIVGTFTSTETITGASSAFTATATDNNDDERQTPDGLPESMEKPLLVFYAASEVMKEKGILEMARGFEQDLFVKLTTLQREIGPVDDDPAYTYDEGEYEV